ncbi:mate-domain-containing protein [Linderina pennispora]|uniref:Mate-domain-containing protein n=1 Tax=Linderina pennispora TaxID=61395 RepID=A0A1Y1WCD6_9FUNG|nr:mate-domain-containing protein [Linderina pennispora]ORX70886.1 mate-domain-containing protein [Linderina pennispora]
MQYSHDDIEEEARQNHIYLDEAKYQATKALPMTIAGILRSWTSVLELRAIGHIGSKELAGRSLALLVVNLTGYPFMYGLGGALESLCSQAFTGARDVHRKTGVYVQHSLWVFLASYGFLLLLWLNPDVVFRLLAKTDPEVVANAKIYLWFECLYFPCIVVQTCLKRFLLAQGLMRPTVYFEAAGLAAMYVSLHVFVWNPSTSLGYPGVPLASTMAANWVDNVRLITQLGVPCAVSGVASYGFADLATIAVTMLGTEALAIQAVLNSAKSALTRTGSYVGMVISNRVGNLLGAQNPFGADLSSHVCLSMVLAMTMPFVLAMLLFRRAIAEFFTTDEAVISGLIPTIPLLAVVVLFDMLSNVLTGVLRGQGRQGAAAVIRVIALYLVAVPLAYTLCFPLHIGLYGLWVSLAVGFVTAALAEWFLVWQSDWHAEVLRCMDRINGLNKVVDLVGSPLQEDSPLISSSVTVY